jgi:hypothetical protein
MWLKKPNLPMEIKQYGSLMTVDTGLHTGISFWSWGYENPNVMDLETYSVNVSRKDLTLYMKMDTLLSDWYSILRSNSPGYVYLEGQEMWSQSAKSFASTAAGNLFTLSYITGAFAGYCIKDKIPFQIIPARKWKGQLSKQATELRVRSALKFYSDEELPLYSDHIIDSIGMGLSLMGLL